MALSIKFDYSLDSNNFFAAPERRAALEAAGDLWASRIRDDFADIEAGATFTVQNPTTGVDTVVVTTETIDDILIYVGANTTPFNNGSSAAGTAGPTGFDLAGTAFNARITNNFRGQGATQDFEPWAGAASFDSDRNWYFGIDGPVPAGQSDFVAIAVHEIGHVLGFGTSATFDALISNNRFVGDNVKTLSANGVETTTDGGHFAQNGPIPSILFPTIVDTRVPQTLDFATLADIGYEINLEGQSFTTTAQKFAIETSGADQIIGTSFVDVINTLAGNDIVQGGAGNDFINGGAGVDQLSGGAGFDALNGGAGNDLLFDDDGGAVFDFAPVNGGSFGTDQVIRFTSGIEFLRFDPALGFSTPQEAFDAISRTGPSTDGSIFTEIVTPSGTVQVFSNAALKVDDFQINIPAAKNGNATADRLVNTSADEAFDGLAGRDTVVFSGTRESVRISLDGDKITTLGAQGRDSYTGVERLEFTKGALVFDIPDALPITFADGSVLPNYAYPLYAASLGRAPDEGGLQFWSNFANSDDVKKVAFDSALGQSAEINGQVRLAAEFVISPEFNTPDTATNDGFVRKLYSNFLDRDTPDTEGFAFWTGIYEQRLRGELENSRLPNGVTIFDSDTKQFVDVTTEQWAKAWMLRDFASHPDIFDRIKDDVSTGLYVVEIDGS